KAATPVRHQDNFIQPHQRAYLLETIFQRYPTLVVYIRRLGVTLIHEEGLQKLLLSLCLGSISQIIAAMLLYTQEEYHCQKQPVPELQSLDAYLMEASW